MLEFVLAIAGIIAASGIGYYGLSHRSKNMLYSRARRLHGRGEKYYSLGDAELAREYYSEAETLRAKARRLR